MTVSERPADNTIALRKSTPELMRSVLRENGERFKRSLDVEPRYPDVRRVWRNMDCGQVLMTTSFAHMNPNNTSRYVVGNHILTELLRGAGIGGSQVLNLLYDLGKPEMDSPSGSRIQLGRLNPKAFIGNLVYAKQRKHQFTIERLQIERELSSIFNHSGSSSERIATVVGMLEQMRSSLDAHGAIHNPIMELRRRQHESIELAHVPEEPLHMHLGKIATALQVLDQAYSKPFYQMPVSEAFDPAIVGMGRRYQELASRLPDGYSPSPHLKALGITGIREPVAFNGAAFAFFNEREQMDRSGVEFDYREGVAYVRREQVYEAMRHSILVPTVPTKTLADAIAPQIPELGGPQWEAYAPAQIRISAEWLGIRQAEAETLFLTTRGLVTYGVRHNHDGRNQGSAENGIMQGFFVSYLTFGAELMRQSVHEGRYIEAEMGRVVDEGTALSSLLR